MCSFTAGCTTIGSSPALSDGLVNRSLGSYEYQQGSIQSLNDSAQHRVASYSLAKAQCWLDVSYHEYSRNDRSEFVPEALRESQRITEYLADGGAAVGPNNPAHTTPLLNNAKQLREDLWLTAAELKLHPGLACASQKLACAEVELVHAGNEYNQQGWRHAKPYVQIAEDGMAAASSAADSCASIQQKQNVAEKINDQYIHLLVTVLFNFDQYSLEEANASSMQRLESIVSQLKSADYSLAELRLTGHADRSNNSGDANYNLLLSQRRADTVLNYLRSQGLASSNTPIEIRGDSTPISACEGKNYNRTEFRQCLSPNRRVEVHLKLTSPQS